jgi:hypothetical protein
LEEGELSLVALLVEGGGVVGVVPVVDSVVAVGDVVVGFDCGVEVVVIGGAAVVVVVGGSVVVVAGGAVVVVVGGSVVVVVVVGGSVVVVGGSVVVVVVDGPVVVVVVVDGTEVVVVGPSVVVVTVDVVELDGGGSVVGGSVVVGAVVVEVDASASPIVNASRLLGKLPSVMASTWPGTSKLK